MVGDIKKRKREVSKAYRESKKRAGVKLVQMELEKSTYDSLMEIKEKMAREARAEFENHKIQNRIRRRLGEDSTAFARRNRAPKVNWDDVMSQFIYLESKYDEDRDEFNAELMNPNSEVTPTEVEEEQQLISQTIFDLLNRVYDLLVDHPDIRKKYQDEVNYYTEKMDRSGVLGIFH